MAKKNITQRSWSDYEGENPIEAWVELPAFSSEARSYVDSPRYGPNAQIPIGRGGKGGGAKMPPAKNLPEPPEGYVYNRFGYLEPAEWYTEEGGVTRKKRSDEYRPQATMPTEYIRSMYGYAGRTSPVGSMVPKNESSIFFQPPPFPRFTPTNILTSNQFGGYPMFPFTNY